MSLNENKVKKKVHMVSLGCPKNLVDAEMMLGTLQKDSYEISDTPEDADAIIVNTCSFIEDSRKESIQTILEMATYKEGSKNKKLIVSGCMPQRYKEELVESLPEADIFIGSGEFQNIDKILREHEKGNTEKKFYHLPTFLQKSETPRLVSGPGHRAYLKISEGCKKRCAFCAIPKIRGNLQSRTVESVVNEAKLLAASGVKELIVVSHDFTDYGWDIRRKDETAIDNNIELLKALSKVEGIRWIRLMYMYPDGITKELLQLMKTEEKILPYFDMPLQHINTDVLKSMNRKMTKEEIVERLNWIREELPEAVIRTQFIVGFPGETNEQFEELVSFVKEFRFDRVGCFQYSPEEGTAGGKMTNQIEEDVKQERFDRLMSEQVLISKQMHQRFIGQTVEVLVEGISEETELLLQGRMAGQAPDIDGLIYINDGNACTGDFVKVEITDSHDYDLIGHIVE